MPKVSQNVPVIVEFIEELIEKEHAYEADGDVYFRVASFEDYGKLSGRDPDELQEQEETNEKKEDPRDFALWKAKKEGEDTSWNSPWGRGRPGWHIECSAMEYPRRVVRDPRRRDRPALPAPRERAGPVARARP
jgi:cysteinyl-tRNA synthetase